VRLEELCAQVTDGKHGDCQDQPGSGFFFLSCKDVSDGKLNYGGAREITETDYWDTHRRTRLEPLDIVITNSGTIGRMALVPPSNLTKRTTFQKSVAILKPIPSKVEPRFLYYLLQAEVERLVAFAGGTAQKNLLLRDLRAFAVEVPSRAVQNGVVSILSAYDDLIENNTRRIRILEEMAQMIYREWIVNFRFPGHKKVKMVESEMGPIPKGWSASSVGCLADDVRRSVDPSELDPETPYIGLEHMPRKSIALSDWGKAGQVQSTKLRFRRGEILFGKIRPYFHKVGVAPVDGVCSSDAIVIVPKQEEWTPVLLCCVSSKEFVDQATQTSQGTKMPRANWGVLTRYPIALPEDSVLNRFNNAISPMVDLIRNLVFRNRNLQTTRDLLLPKLISGEVSVENLEVAATA
jgi:type I restriction enzyme S subunit